MTVAFNIIEAPTVLPAFGFQPANRPDDNVLAFHSGVMAEPVHIPGVDHVFVKMPEPLPVSYQRRFYGDFSFAAQSRLQPLDSVVTPQSHHVSRKVFTRFAQTAFRGREKVVHEPGIRHYLTANAPVTCISPVPVSDHSHVYVRNFFEEAAKILSDRDIETLRELPTDNSNIFFLTLSHLLFGQPGWELLIDDVFEMIKNMGRNSVMDELSMVKWSGLNVSYSQESDMGVDDMIEAFKKNIINRAWTESPLTRKMYAADIETVFTDYDKKKMLVMLSQWLETQRRVPNNTRKAYLDIVSFISTDIALRTRLFKKYVRKNPEREQVLLLVLHKLLYKIDNDYITKHITKHIPDRDAMITGLDVPALLQADGITQKEQRVIYHELSARLRNGFLGGMLEENLRARIEKVLAYEAVV